MSVLGTGDDPSSVHVVLHVWASVLVVCPRVCGADARRAPVARSSMLGPSRVSK